MPAEPSSATPPPVPEPVFVPEPEPAVRVLRTRQSTGREIYLLVVVAVLLIGVGAYMVLAPRVQTFVKVVQDAKAPLTHPKPPPPLSAEQQGALERFGPELARAIRLQDASKLTLLMDDEALAGRVFDKLPDAFELPGSRTTLINNLHRGAGRWLLELTGGGAEYVRTHVREGFPAVVLRTGHGQPQYADILVRPYGDGFKVVDGFNRLLAWTVSDDLCYNLARGVPVPGEAALDALPGVTAMMKPAARRELPGLLHAMRLLRAEDLLFYLDGLPREVDQEPLFLRQRLRALQPLASAGKLEHIRDFKTALLAAPAVLGADCTADAALAGMLRLENDRTGVDECLKRLTAAVGGDPQLTYLRAENFLTMARHADALALLDELDRGSAKTEKTASLRIRAQLDRKDYPALVQELRTFKQSFGVALGRQNFFKDLDSHDFLASPEYLAWEKESTTGAN
jgi:hypothetical protein